MGLKNGGFGVVEIIFILAVLILLVLAFGDEITRFVANVIQYIMQMSQQGGNAA